MQRPTGPLCDGCHSVNYNIQTKTVTEWNVGCEKCHGPGSDARRSTLAREHRQSGAARLRARQRRLHPVPFAGPAADESDRRQVLRLAGRLSTSAMNLSDFWKLEEHKLGETTFTHFPDGTAHKNRMQGNDFVQSVMYTHGVTCFSCHDVHGTATMPTC